MCGSYPYLKVRHFNLKKGVTPMETDIIFKMYSTPVNAHILGKTYMHGGIYT